MIYDQYLNEKYKLNKIIILLIVMNASPNDVSVFLNDVSIGKMNIMRPNNYHINQNINSLVI